MKEKFKISTPVGTGIVEYGEFMPNDGRKNKFHCWWGGCGIGGESDTLKEAREYLINYTKEYLRREIEKLEEKSSDIRLCLREIS